jgi:hypothetical protein
MAAVANPAVAGFPRRAEPLPPLYHPFFFLLFAARFYHPFRGFFTTRSPERPADESRVATMNQRPADLADLACWTATLVPDSTP